MITVPNTEGGAGGSGGGGAGGGYTPGGELIAAIAGAANTGGGGGGSAYMEPGQDAAAAGGSGVVIVRYQGSQAATGGTISSGTGGAAGYTIHTYTNTGSGNFDLSVSMNSRLGATLSGNITGTGDLTYNGPGRLSVTGTNTYTGSTAVTVGTLAINGDNGAATNAVTVSSGATLAGSGTVGGQITVGSGGTLAPGNSPGLMTATNGVSLETGSTFQWELIGNTADGRGTNYDALNVSGGTLSIGTGAISSLVFNGAGSTVSWVNSFWGSDRSWLVFSNAGSPTLGSVAVFDTINISADIDSLVLTNVRSQASFGWNREGDDVYLTYSAVPEPTTYALLALAAAGLGAHVIRCRRR